MSKNSTDTKENRRATDGRIPTEDISSTLIGTGTGGAAVVDLVEETTLDVELTNVNLEIIDFLRAPEGLSAMGGPPLSVSRFTACNSRSNVTAR